MQMNAQSNRIFLSLSVIVIIFLIRFFSQSPLLVDGESYYNIRISEEIKDNAIIENDPLGEPYVFSAIHYMLAPLSYSMKVFLPLLFGLLAGFFYFKVQEKKYSYISTGLLFLSPLFLTTFTTLSNEMFAVVMVLFNLYLLKKGRIILFTFIQTLLVLTHFEIWLLSSIYFMYSKRNFIAFIPGAILAPFNFSINYGFQRIFSELGGSYGYSLFLFLLAIIGLIWRKKDPLKAVIILFAISITFFFPQTRLLGALILLPYASRTIIKLVERRWELQNIRQATIFLVFLVIIFSSVAKASELVVAEPYDIEVYSILESYPEGRVLADSEKGHYIQFFAKKPVFVDSISDEEKILETKMLLKSQNSLKVHSYLEENNISYVLVDTTEERDGFLFIADNSERFELLASGNKELWRFLG